MKALKVILCIAFRLGLSVARGSASHHTGQLHGICLMAFLIFSSTLGLAGENGEKAKEVESAYFATARKILNDIKTRCAEDKKLKFLSGAEIEYYHDVFDFKQDGGGVLYLKCETDDFWDDLPIKGSSKPGSGAGQIEISFYQNMKDPGWTPIGQLKDRFMIRTVLHTDTADTLTTVYTFTKDPDAHRRLCTIVRDAMEKHGMKVKKP